MKDIKRIIVLNERLIYLYFGILGKGYHTFKNILMDIMEGEK